MDKISVYRNGQLTTRIERSERDLATTNWGMMQEVDGDTSLRWLSVALNNEPSIDPHSVSIEVHGDVARLSGEVDNVYAVKAVRSIASSIPGVAVIVDDLWLSCQ